MSAHEHFLDRTLRLIREELTEAATDEGVLSALNGTHVAIIATADNANSYSAQTAIVSAALLLARCGLQVWLDVPDVVLAGPQPPLIGGKLVTALTSFAASTSQMLHVRVGRPHKCHVAIALGDSPSEPANEIVELRLNCRRWTGILGDSTPWPNIVEPFGGMVAAAMASAEAFKCAMRRLRRLARSQDIFDAQFRVNTHYSVAVAPEATPLPCDLGTLDLVSAGAVTNAALYSLLRVPNVHGKLRVIEPQQYETSNHNRCMMMCGDSVGRFKAKDMLRYTSDVLTIQPIIATFQHALSTGLIDSLAAHVIVGVDDIPTRWDAQRAAPNWLSVGATTHWSAMSSFHLSNGPCAQCLHPRNDGDAFAPAPTISFVSFWAGLWSAVYLLRNLTGCTEPAQQTFLTPTALSGPKAIWITPVAIHSLCPIHGTAA